jgi:general secretion pathway protein F
MPRFEYQAIDRSGAELKGGLDAVDGQTAEQKLRAKGLVVVSLRASQQSSAVPGDAGVLAPNRWNFVAAARPLAAKELALVTRQLATLARVAPLEEALATLATQPNSRAMMRMLKAAHEGVREGERLSVALARVPGAVPVEYRALVGAGESASRLPVVLERLAALLEVRQELASRVTSALVYPLVLAAVAVFVIAALLVLVVPKVVAQFSVTGRELPMLTQAIIAISDFLIAGWPYVLALMVVGVLAFNRAMTEHKFASRVDGFLLRLPFLGGFLRQVEASGFARTLSTMISGGLPVLEALQMTQATVRNRVMQAGVVTAAAGVREGGGLSAALKRTGVFPPLLVYFTANGESSGQLDPMLEAAADYLDRDVRTASSVFLTLLEPAIIVIMGVFVAMIVLAILLPILQINTLGVS